MLFPNQSSRFFLPGTLVVQLALTLPFLGSDPLWVDEAYSSVLARSSFTEINHLLRFDAGPPLYYYMLHVWQILAGSSETALRIPSLFFALATTVTLYFIAKKELGTIAANAAAILWAINPLVWHYALEARHYTVFAWLTLVFLYTLIRFVRTPAWRECAWIPLGIALIYTHNLAMFVVAIGAALAVTYIRSLKTGLWLGAGLGLIALSYIPWIPVLLQQMQNTALTIDWVKHFWTPWAPLLSLNAFLPGGWIPLYLDRPAFPALLQALVILITLSAVITSLPFIKPQDKKHLWLPAAIAGLLAAPYIASWVSTPVYLIARTDFIALPLFLLLLAGLLTRIPHRFAVHATLIIFVGSGLAAIALEITRETPVDQTQFEIYLQRSIREGDIVLCTGLTRPVIDQALRERQVTLLSYPRDMQVQLAHINEGWYNETLDLRSEAQAIITEGLALRDANNSTLWIIASPRPINGPLIDPLGDSIKAVPLPNAGLRKLNEPLDIFRHVSR